MILHWFPCQTIISDLDWFSMCQIKAGKSCSILLRCNLLCNTETENHLAAYWDLSTKLSFRRGHVCNKKSSARRQSMFALSWDQTPPILKQRVSLIRGNCRLKKVCFQSSHFRWVCLLISVVYNNLGTR